ncbi:hypothetical protein OESDEN_15229 [Oesophagostomum dentatum]|uniref:Uncharacterized protein n=1 Tax=Oesophagostomum dentatum TaxID=61180 RepID=A0A0B1SPC6_OESDE|nr:hypothetical protein OESDEN_15229 [Oesophagostomum dentatum]
MIYIGPFLTVSAILVHGLHRIKQNSSHSIARFDIMNASINPNLTLSVHVNSYYYNPEHAHLYKHAYLHDNPSGCEQSRVESRAASLIAGFSDATRLDEARYESVLGTDPGTQLPYMQGSVEITRQEVELGSHLEEFACQCYASGASESHVVRSDPARIRIACEFGNLQEEVNKEK